jgi:hypothetical protein
MPLRAAEAPSRVLDEVRSTLNHFAKRGQFRTPALARARADRLTLAVPHPVYTLSLQDLVEGRGLRDSRLVAWRYLVEADRTPIASAEVVVESEGQAPKFSQFNEGPFVQSTAAAIDELQRRSELQEISYEFRALQIPALYVVALWLADQGGGERDLVRALDPAPGYLDLERLYSEGEFLEQLREPARTQLAFDSSPRQEGTTST